MRHYEFDSHLLRVGVPIAVALALTVGLAGCGHKAPTARSHSTVRDRRTADLFIHDVISGHSARALRILGDNADLYRDSLPRLSALARAEHMRVLSVTHRKDGAFRYRVRGRGKVQSDTVVASNGYFDVFVGGAGGIANWDYEANTTMTATG